MYLLSIQGRYAPAFQLKNDAALQLKKQVEGLTHQQAHIISSRFRTDLVYEDDENRLEDFLERWCKSLGYPYKSDIKLKFFRSAEEDVSLSQFFYRLHLLKRIPNWYNAYLEKLVQLLAREGQCPLCTKLSEAMKLFCDSVELLRIKQGQDSLLKSVNEFVKLKHLAAYGNKNYN